MAESDHPYFVGFDLGGTKMMAVVFDEKWRELGRYRRKTKAHAGTAAGLDRVRKTLSDALYAAGLKSDQLTAIGVGVPGPVDTQKGIILDLPNLGWENVGLKAELEKTFKCPVAVVNDVDAGTYGEYRLGAAQGKRCVLGVFPGTGIGGGCVYDGAIIRGEAISAMEIGHICVLPEGPLCGCGQRGCLEALAGRLAIAQAAVAAAYRGEAPYLLQRAGLDIGNVRSGLLAEAIAAGDTVIEGIVRNAATWLGRGVASVVNLMAPDVVILGGGLVEAMPKLYVEVVETTVRKFAMPAFSKISKVTAAKLGDDSTVLGAATWAESLARKEKRS